MLFSKKIIQKIKNTTKEEVKEAVSSHKTEIFCTAMATLAAVCLCGVLRGPRPSMVYVTVNMKGV